MAISKELLDADLLRLVTAGSVDDGKSTLIGRLLYDTKQILTDQLEHIEDASRRRGHDYVDLALLTDGLRAEREQGITIDVAYRSFVTPRRRFQLADAPGHVQYTRNMVTGASTADLAVILVDARKGVVEQTRRHGYITSILETPHVVFAVNKMDLVGFAEETFRSIESDLHELGSRLGLHDPTAIPISALKGDNVVDATDSMPWYDGPTLLQHLEAVPNATDRNLHDRRFPVQWVIRPGHDYRGYAGQVAGGVWRAGDEVVVLPSGLRSRVAAVETADGAARRRGLADVRDDPARRRARRLPRRPARRSRPASDRRASAARARLLDERAAARPAREAARQADDAPRPRDRRRARVEGGHRDARGRAVSRAAGVERPRGRVASPGRAARRRSLRGQPLDRARSSSSTRRRTTPSAPAWCSRPRERSRRRPVPRHRRDRLARAALQPGGRRRRLGARGADRVVVAARAARRAARDRAHLRQAVLPARAWRTSSSCSRASARGRSRTRAHRGWRTWWGSPCSALRRSRTRRAGTAVGAALGAAGRRARPDRCRSPASARAARPTSWAAGSPGGPSSRARSLRRPAR